jgi:predicted ATPase
VRRYVITGAPGAGKTTVVDGLRERGYAVVEEAATEVNLRSPAAEPWREPGFLDAIAALQRSREEAPVPPGTRVQVLDRSPICTLALAWHLGRPVTPLLAREIDRVDTEKPYQATVFFVRLLGFITPTEVRRISYADSVSFERLHEAAYREHGFDLVEIPPGTPEERIRLVESYLDADRTSS